MFREEEKMIRLRRVQVIQKRVEDEGFEEHEKRLEKRRVKDISRRGKKRGNKLATHYKSEEEKNDVF